MIRIQNIYYMLSYAFQVLNEQGYKQVATEEFDNVAELCAAILIKGVSLQIKRGLGKEYVVQSEPLSSLRGKIDISASVKQQSMLKKQLVCHYDEFSVNSYLNRIIRTTMDVLVRSEISKERKKQLRKLLIYFSEVEPLSRESINWKLQFNKNNQTYQMLISICYLILKGLLQTTSDGSTKLMDFLDEQRMCRLYEKFILEYYRKEHPEIRASASQIPWDTDDDYREMLPVMQSDITEFTAGAIRLSVYESSERGSRAESGIMSTVSIGDYDMLVTGDVEKVVERELVSLHDLTDTELLIVPHHGSKYSTSDELLSELRPETAVISTGYNRYGHPTKETLDKLNEYGVNVLRTDELGRIVLHVASGD